MTTKEDREEAAAEREYQRSRDKEAKTEPAPTLEPEVTPLHTPLEATTELRDYVYYVQTRLAKGSKSDIDKIGLVLELIIVVLNEIIAETPPPPEALSVAARDPLDAF